MVHKEVLRLSLINRKWYFRSRHPRLYGKLIFWDEPLKHYEKEYRLQKFMDAYPPKSMNFPFNEVEVNDSFSKTDWLVMEYILKNHQPVKKLTLKVSQNDDNLSEHVTAE